MSYITVKADISSALEKFGMVEDEAKKAIVRALNRAAKSVQVQAAREIREAGYNLKASRIKKALTVRQANANVLQAGIRAIGRPISLYEYGARSTSKGVSVNVKGGRKLIKHAFIATMPTGHTGVFMRKPGVIQGKRGKMIQARALGHELFGPAIPSMFVSEIVTRAMTSKLNEQFPKELDHELGRLRARGR